MQDYDFENSIGFIVNRTARAFVKALDMELRENVGVSVGQWKVIVMLVKQNGLTQKETADKLGLEGATLIPIIDKMEKEGLVVRRVDSSDRRNNRIYRTEKADVLWDRMVDCATKVREVSTKHIPEENISIMRNVLEKIWQNLRVEFDVSCATVDINNSNSNNTGLVEPIGKGSSNISINSPTNTATTIHTALTSAKRTKNNKN
jgi:MarR family transcriptional regulator, transcriptional regulator for hemolysin